jgi:hypothetical protein
MLRSNRSFAPRWERVDAPMLDGNEMEVDGEGKAG